MLDTETTITYIVQRRKARGEDLAWVDASEHDTEEEMNAQYEAFIADLGAVLGPFRKVRRVETVI